MEISWMYILYTILLIDSMGAIIVAWFGQRWWMHYMGEFGKHFPAAKGWAIYYFVLVLIIGYLLGLF